MTEPVVKKVTARKVASAKKVASSASKSAASLSGKKPATPKAKTTSGSRAKGEARRQATKPAGERKPPVKSTAAPVAESKESPQQSSTRRAATSVKKSAARRVGVAKKDRAATASAVKGKYRRDYTSGLAEMRPKTRTLAAEYMAALILAMILLFIPEDKSYHNRLARFFVQVTGISGIFFVLALASSSEKASRYAIPFGLLIDLSMLAYVFKEGGAKTIQKALGAKSASGDQSSESIENSTKILDSLLISTPSQVGGNLTINPQSFPQTQPPITYNPPIPGVTH